VAASNVVRGKKLNLDIAVLDVSSLRVHEEIIPELLNQLTYSIESDGCVRHPIIVDRRSLVVLDGVHRVSALQKLSISRVPAYLVDYDSPAIRVLSWYRSVTGVSNVQQVISQAKRAGCALKQIDTFNEKVIGVSPTAAVLKLPKQVFLVNCPFNHLSEAYDIIGRIEETWRAAGLTIRYEAERDALKKLEQGRVDAVLCTPKISKDEIVKSALSGRVFEWKATRHVIPARPLSVNVPLSLLKDTSKSLAEVDHELIDLLKRKKLKQLPSGSIVEGRRYEEEVYVFEE